MHSAGIFATAFSGNRINGTYAANKNYAAHAAAAMWPHSSSGKTCVLPITRPEFGFVGRADCGVARIFLRDTLEVFHPFSRAVAVTVALPSAGVGEQDSNSPQLSEPISVQIQGATTNVCLKGTVRRSNEEDEGKLAHTKGRENAATCGVTPRRRAHEHLFLVVLCTWLAFSLLSLR